jgi:putative tryptophan/tyrosine transport system substrate-binding protein
MERYRSRVSRRAFLAGAGGLGLVAGCGRLPWQAPPPTPRVGYLAAISATDAVEVGRVDAFVQGLQGLGYIEGHNILIERRYAEGQASRLPELLAELIPLPVNLIVAGGTIAIRAAKDATDTLPIVMVIANEPVRQGLVASLARPGGNLTGLTQMNVQLTGKHLELLKLTVPALSRVGFLWNSAIPDRDYELQETEVAAQALALSVHPLEARTQDDLEAAVEAAVSGRLDGLLLQNNILSAAHHARIAELAARSRLPVISGFPEFAAAGGLMGYGPNLNDMYRRAAYYVDRILKGAKPADLPIEQPMTFDFVVNLKTAAALGITFPNEIMLQVTEVIQ